MQNANIIFKALTLGLEIEIGGNKYCLFKHGENYSDHGRFDFTPLHTAVFQEVESWSSANKNDVHKRWMMYTSEIGVIFALAKSATEEEIGIIVSNIVLNMPG